jgi:hypothetical protein
MQITVLWRNGKITALYRQRTSFMYRPNFTITPKIAQTLMDIEAAKQAVADLPMTAKTQARLRRLL